MRINKKYAYVALLVVFLLLALCIAFYFTKKPSIPNIKTSEIKCSSFKDRFPNIKCGYSQMGTSGVYHQIVGVIVKKITEKNEYYFDLATINSKDDPFVWRFAIAPDPMPKSITTLIKSKDIIPGKSIDPIDELNAKEFYNKINENQEVILTLFTPDKKVIEEAIDVYGDLKMFKCVELSKELSSYLKSSSSESLIRLEAQRVSANCHIAIQGIQVIK